jgi:hypothetical protein
MFFFSLLDFGTWLASRGQHAQSSKPAAFFASFIMPRITGYSTKVFCLFCVAWQFYICFDKYLSEPVVTNVAYVSNNGKYPIAITFCKMILYSNITDHDLNGETFKDLMIEANFLGAEDWALVFKERIFTRVLPYRKFLTYTWSEDVFYLCFSLQLGNELQTLRQLRIKYRFFKTIDGRTTNLQIFFHSWGSFSTLKYEIPTRNAFRVIHMRQSTVVTLSTKKVKCSSYEMNSLDECLESKAVKAVNASVGCITELLR